MKFSDYGKWVKLFALNYTKEIPINIEDDSINDVMMKASSVIKDEETHYIVLKKYLDGQEQYFLRADLKDTRWVIDLFDYRDKAKSDQGSGSFHYWCSLDQLANKLKEVVSINSL